MHVHRHQRVEQSYRMPRFRRYQQLCGTREGEFGILGQQQRPRAFRDAESGIRNNRCGMTRECSSKGGFILRKDKMRGLGDGCGCYSGDVSVRTVGVPELCAQLGSEFGELHALNYRVRVDLQGASSTCGAPKATAPDNGAPSLR